MSRPPAFLAGCFRPSHAVHTLTETICDSIKVCNSGQGQPQIILDKFGGSTLPCCDAHPGIMTNDPVWTHSSKSNNINQYFTITALYILQSYSTIFLNHAAQRAIRPKSAS
ncbi:hypothetical protein BQ8794_200043 [Mesorhizobium prunaredense]|uniref:Uncharacterized protein n=1 Tax=Mesorhizobium prunaredense TaxID=1631249 RepID=A0A1R3V5E2_9HYPH|nr:hypothetical protein BQ8794_200043 [Mesorhizobium prunaredense]